MNHLLRLFNSFSIRSRIILGQATVIGVVTIFIYSYYPAQQERIARTAIRSEIASVVNMFSIGIGIGMGETDFVAVGEAVEWAKGDPSLVFVSVVNMDSQIITEFNLMGSVPKEVANLAPGSAPLEIDGVIYVKEMIRYQDISFGSIAVGYSLTALKETIADLRRTTFYFCITIFIGGLCLAVLISNMISHAVRRLNLTVQRISNGAENIRVDIRGSDEVGKLGAAFNHMLDRLDSSRTALLKGAERLQRQNEELNRFSYVVSHDLKAPLRAIFKLSEWIEEDLGEAIPEETKQNMKTLRGRVFRMEALINGLLEYSKIGRTEAPVERIDVHHLLEEIIEMLNPPPNVSVVIKRRLPTFRTKKILLQQVFINLLSNAIKYNDKSEGLVEISFVESDRFYRFAVKDNGVGIHEDYHEKIFEIFRTLNARDKVESTGVGLSIIKKSVEDMGGTVAVESACDAGSTFTFTWPKAA